MTSFSPWWYADGALQRFLASLVESELVRLRPGTAAPSVAVDADLAHDLGADSLELMALTASVAEVLQLPQAGLLDGLLGDTRLSAWTGVVSAALEQVRPGALTFRTSGSAGTPKPCSHALVSLQQEVAELARLLPGRRRVFAAVPAHHIYGFLFTILLPAALQQDGALPVIDVRDRVAAGVLQQAAAGDLVIGHPAWWQAAMAGGAVLAGDVTGVTSTAPCPDALAHALAAAGLARLVQVYGSSETAGVGWRDSPGAPYALLPYWGRIEEDDMTLARTMADGSIARFPLQDRLAWHDRASFLPAGRRDDAVQVGGVNVFPLHVAEVLKQHPDVSDAVVRLMRGDEGARLKAYLVGEGASLASRVEAWARERLGVAERPASYTVGAELPRQRNGKLADWIIDAG